MSDFSCRDLRKVGKSMRKQMQIKKLIVHGVAVLGLAALVATGGSEASAKKRVLPKKIKTTGNTLKQSEMLVKLKEKEKIGYTVKPK